MRAAEFDCGMLWLHRCQRCPWVCAPQKHSEAASADSEQQKPPQLTAMQAEAGNDRGVVLWEEAAGQTLAAPVVSRCVCQSAPVRALVVQ